MKLKKLLSVILSVCCVFNLVSPLQVFAEDYCDTNRNKKGGYIDYNCANSELLKVAYNKANFATVENLGPSGVSEYYCFNFRALDDVFKKNKLISVAELRKERDSLDKAFEDPFLNLNTGLKIGLTSLLGAIGGYFISKSTKDIKPQSTGSSSAQSSMGSSPRVSRSSSFDDLTLKEYKLRRGFFPAFIVVLISGLALLIGLYFNYNAQKNNFETDRKNKLRELNNKIVEINRSNEHRSNMLNLLLKTLEDPRIMSNIDMFCFYDRLDDTHCTPFDYDAKYAGINYTKAELESFPEKFKEIAAKIRKNLKENGKLDPDNEIVSKPDSEQRELSD